MRLSSHQVSQVVSSLPCLPRCGPSGVGTFGVVGGWGPGGGVVGGGVVGGGEASPGSVGGGAGSVGSLGGGLGSEGSRSFGGTEPPGFLKRIQVSASEPNH